MMIVDAGRAFEFLAWYRAVTISNEMRVAPQTPASNKVRAIGRQARLRIERLSELLDLS